MDQQRDVMYRPGTCARCERGLERDASARRVQMHVFGPAGTVILQCWLCGTCRPAPADVTATSGVLAERILRWYRSNPDLWPTLRLSGNG
jgi:hypothetical protein